MQKAEVCPHCGQAVSHVEHAGHDYWGEEMPDYSESLRQWKQLDRNKGGRPCLGDGPMTVAERMRRSREQRKHDAR